MHYTLKNKMMRPLIMAYQHVMCKLKTSEGFAGPHCPQYSET